MSMLFASLLYNCSVYVRNLTELSRFDNRIIHMFMQCSGNISFCVRFKISSAYVGIVIGGHIHVTGDVS